MGDIASNFGDELDGMEHCLRALASPNAGRLVEAETTKEIAHASGDVLVFAENVVIDFELIDRLLRSPDRNLP
ncbi:hypothetical protein GGE07_006510 [Sinorhizobium terangae]|uniref:hypothetical protein n=1 Tax=Sinorhizobium terangae TaxID=110322 RepID=UPI00185A4F5D|nr:hypothetical protein [Sinorhizobium terangae]MBB4189806.1 hypothetical protein [Sinorhizobium terangae]